MSQDNSAHIEARTLILEHAVKLAEESTDNVTQVFASAVRAYLEAEQAEPCLHLHDGSHVGPCPSTVSGSASRRGRGSSDTVPLASVLSRVEE